ncbi:MAG TPA: cupin domain-containing protein [Firmicutes bacterium]|nr:cupin domain-containing protein [Bacillota bacterium]
MGANIKIVKLHNTKEEGEVSRVPRNFVKGQEHGCEALNSCDHCTYYTGGHLPSSNHLEFEEVFYFIRGTGVFTLDGKDIPVGPGSVVVVPLESFHSVKNTGKDVLEHIVCSAFVDVED